MIDGSMQAFALTLDKFLDHAAKWHPDAEVVTAREGGKASTGSAMPTCASVAARVSTVLGGLGIAAGDRVATLAWNSQAHVESLVRRSWAWARSATRSIRG
jgi:acyl-CoA synthetase (AMP-forming)/AMP-acid ligase II